MKKKKTLYIHIKPACEILIAAVFLSPPKFTQHSCPSNGDYINKPWYILKIQYYSATKKEWTTDKHNMNEAQMHYAKMPDYNIYAYHSITYNLFCKIADAKNRPVVTVVCGWRYEFTIRGHRVCGVVGGVVMKLPIPWLWC